MNEKSVTLEGESIKLRTCLMAPRDGQLGTANELVEITLHRDANANPGEVTAKIRDVELKVREIVEVCEEKYTGYGVLLPPIPKKISGTEATEKRGFVVCIGVDELVEIKGWFSDERIDYD